MHRRSFLSRTLAAMLATGVAPAALTARDKSGTKNVIIGNRLAAIDVYDQFFVAEQLNGELSLYHIAPTEQIAQTIAPNLQRYLTGDLPDGFAP